MNEEMMYRCDTDSLEKKFEDSKFIAAFSKLW